MTDTPAAVSVAGAAAMYGLSVDTIRQAINRGALPAKRIGRVIRIDTAALREWFAALEDVTS